MDNSTEDGKPYPEYNYEAVSDTYQMESTQNHNDTSKNYQEQDLNQFGNGHFYQEQDLNQSESYSSQLNQPQSPLLNPSNQPPSQPHFYENDLYQVEEDGYDDKDEFGLYNSNYAKQTYPNQSPKKALSVHSNMDEDVVTALPTLKSPSIPVVRRASILQVSAVANEQSSLFVKNVFGKSDHPGGLVNIIPLETQLTVDYRWEIPLDHFTNTEKVVSLPFGPRDWSWQVVLYPSGVGDVLDKSLSAFLRPIKNETELVSETWSRPITQFSFRLKKNTDGVLESNVDEFGNVVHANDYVVQFSEDTFTEFTNQTPGWGFTDYCPLPLPFTDLMTDANTMIMDIQVIGTTRVKTSTIVFEEQLYVSAAAVDQSLYSSYFGPPSCQWQVRFSLVFDDMNRLCNMSGYLAPVKSQFEESLGNQWDRAISTFQLNIYNPITQQLMVSKSWTGGFNFAEFNSLAGWESLFEETLTEMIDTFTFKVEVTWDPALLNEYTGLGKAKAALNSSSVNISQLEQQLEAAFAAKLQYIEEKQTLTGYIDRLTTQLQELQVKSVKQDEALKELDLLRQRNNLITTELAAVRDEQRSHHVREIVFASAKERLANLRLSITREEFNSQPLEQGLEYQLESCQAELAEMRHEKAQLDLKLAQALSELHFVNRSNKDNVLMAPIVSHDDTYGSEEIQTVDPIERIGQAIETGRNECTLGRAAIEELNSKIQVMSIKQGTKSEKAGLIADISMLQCGLDVASATMYEAAESLHLLEDKSEFDTIQLDLEDVRRKLVDIKNGLEMSINGILSYRKQSGVSHNGGEIGLPPKSINGSIQSFIGTPASVSRTPALPITKSPAKPGSRTPLQKSNTLAFEDDMNQQDENVAPGDLKKISNRIDSIVDLIKNSFTPNGQVNWSVDEIESWTPAEDQNSKLDAQQLQILLKELKQNQNGKMYSIFYILGSLLSIFFITYATVFVICNPNQSSTALSTYQPACNSVILPTWNSAQTQWHKLCEKMILDIIPTTFKKVKVATRKLKRIAKAKFVDQSKRDRDQRKSSKSNDFEFETVLEHHPKTVDKKGNRESEYAITSSKKSSSSSSDTDAPTIVSSTRSKSKGSRHTSNTIRSVTNIPSVDSKINDKIVQQTVIQSPVIQSTEIVSDLIKPEVDIPISTSEIVENKSDSITPSQISTEINDLPSTSITDVDNGEEEIDQDPVSYHAEHVDLNHLVQDAVTSDSWTESNVVYDTLVDPTDTVQEVETDIIQIDELDMESKEVQDDVSISSTATTQAQSVEITTTQAQSVEITPVDDHHNTSVDPVNEDVLSSLPDSDTSVADIIQPPTETVESTYTSDNLESNTVLESIKEPTSSIESTSIETTINTLINEKEVKTAIDDVADNFNISEKETKTIAEESSILPASTGGSELKESLTYDKLEESEASVTNSNLESFDKETITDNELNDTTVNEDQNVESMGDQNDSDNEYFEGNDLDGGVTANEEEDNTTVMEQISTVSQSVDLELEAKIQQSTDIDDDGVIVEDDISNLVVIPDTEEGIFTILPYTDEQNLTDAENLKGNVIDEAEEVEVGEKAIQPTTVISESIPSEGAGALPEDVTEESISN